MSQSTQQKLLVQQSYDAMATDFHAWAKDKAPPRLKYTGQVLDRIPPDSSVLEIGCGAGEPVLMQIAQHPNVSNVFANDISGKLLELARERCPEAKFFHGDMMALEFEGRSLNAVLGFFSIFHLPREEQKEMFGKIFAWLKEDGVVAVNFSTASEEQCQGVFFGRDMIWSGWGAEGSATMLMDVGFEVEKREILEVEAEDEKDPDYGKKFFWVLARKRAKA